MSRIKDLRMQLTPEQVKNILAKYGVGLHEETEDALIFPTACHNETGGSPKLYYYKNEKIFKCYTECNKMFDIFDFLIRMKKVRGENISLPNAIAMTGVENNQDIDSEVLADLEYLRKLSNATNSITESNPREIEILDKDIIDSFLYNKNGVSPWLEEGITEEALHRFNIKYDSKYNAIIIPNLDHEGHLIGIRGRFFGENAKAKYMPIIFNQQILSHPTGKFLYGFYENKNMIKKKGIVVLFEGEKSVLKMDSYYPGKNVALSTSGKKITLDQLNALLTLNINEVVLAYDKDYRDKTEREEKIQEYEKIISVLKPYFEVSMLIDFENLLEYKDSPIDKGKENFEKLMKNRIKR